MARERRDTKNRLLSKGEYQSSNGRYMYRYVDHNGEDRYVYSWTLTNTDRTPHGKRGGKCLRDLEREIARDLQDEIDRFNARKLTLNAFFDDYIESKQELKPSTRTNYKYMYKKYVSESLGKRKLPDIKYSDIKKFYNSLIRERGFKPNSMEIIHTILHPIFSVAVRDGYIRTNPTDGVMAEIKKSHDWEKPKRHSLTNEQQQNFIQYVRDSPENQKWLPIMVFLLGTGCRVGEAVGIRWQDCDFKKDVISINHNLVYRPTEETGKVEFHITTPKTHKGTREIPMSKHVKEVLLAEQERQRKTGWTKTEVDGYSGFVFMNRFGDVLSPHNINRAIERIVKDYNKREEDAAKQEHRSPDFLPQFTAHNLRHTFCTRMCEKIQDTKIIQEIMGHADISTTLGIYHEVTLARKQAEFARVDDYVVGF